MGRPSNKVQRRAEIVHALMIVMASKGYEGASIQAIAKQAGLAPGLIHYHFKTKQEILVEAINQLSQILEQRYLSMSETATNAEEKLVAFINSRLAKGEGANIEAVKSWVVIAAEAITQDEVRNVFVEIMQKQKAVLTKLVSDYYRGELNSSQLQNKVAFIMSFMEGAFSLSVSAAEILPSEWAAETLIEFLAVSK